MGKFDDSGLEPIEDVCPWCGVEVDERRASYDMWLEEHVMECVAAQMELRSVESGCDVNNPTLNTEK